MNVDEALDRDHELDVNLCGLTVESLQTVVECLRQNNIPTNSKLKMHVSGDQMVEVQAIDLVPFWDAIASSVVLEKVSVGRYPNDETLVSPPLLQNQLLEVVAQNKSIKTLGLRNRSININSLSTFFRTTTSVAELGLFF